MQRNSIQRALECLVPCALIFGAFGAFAAFGFACGGSTGSPGGTGTSSGGGSSGGSGSSGGAGSSGGSGSSGGAGSSGGGSSGGASSGGLVAACPAAAPNGGTECDASVTCQYGTDPDLSCDTLATCTGNAWGVTPPTTGGSCPTGAPGQGSCPSTYPTANASCTTEAACAYPQGLCGCSNPDPVVVEGMDAGLVWSCELPASGCPEPRPAAGSPCATEGQMCDYGSCVVPGGPQSFQCTGGAWYVQAEFCNE